MGIIFITKDDLFHRQIYDELRAQMVCAVVFMDEGDISKEYIEADWVVYYAPKIHSQRLNKIKKIYADTPILCVTNSSISDDVFRMAYPAPVHIVMTLVAGAGRNDVTQRPLLNYQEDIIFHCLKAGQSNKEIARQYDLPLSTTKYHIQKLYRKLGIHHRRDINADF